MKKLLFLFFAFFALVSIGQNAAPSGTLNLIPSPSTYYRAADSTVWDYKGTPYIWNRRLTDKDFSALNTNYLIKWSGSSLAKSILFDNGTNIGVGTASPTVKLEVIGDFNSGFGSSSTRVVGIGLDGSFTTGKTGIFRFSDSFNQLETTFNGAMIGRSYHGWQFYTAYGEVARFGTGSASLDSYFNGNVIFNSNVGIGTSAPSEMLTVVGRVFSGGLSSGLSISAAVGKNASDNNPDIDLRRWAGSSTIHGTARMSADASGNLIFSNHQQATNTVATAEHMRIDGSGNIGMGTISPSDKLEVTGNIRQTWAASIYNWMIYDNSFRQGVQYDGTNRILNLFSTSGDTGGDIAFKTRLGAGSSSSDVGTEKVRIKASGFVGVGYITDPGATNLLAVNGNTYLNGDLTVRSTGYGVGKVLASDTNGKLTYTTPTAGTVTSITGGLGLSGGAITISGTLAVDTANVSILSRQRAAHDYQPLITVSTTANYWRGDKTWQSFTTAVEADSVVTTSKARRHYPVALIGTSGLILNANQGLSVDTASTIILSRQRAANAYQPKGTYNTGAGTLNYVPKYSATGSTLANSQIFDNGTFVGLGYTTDPDAATFVSKLAVSGNIQASGVADIWTGIYSPIHLGGSGTASSLTLQSTSGIGAAGSNIYFKVGSNGGTVPMTVFYNGLTAIGTGTASTAYLTIGGGATGGVASLVIGSGTLLSAASTPAGAIQNNGSHLYWTPTAGSTGYQLDAATMTATVGGYVPTPPNDATKYLNGQGAWTVPAGGGGSGTVTSVSVTTANGVSGTVATATTTPAISLTLGDITPSKVNTLYVDARKAGSAIGNNIWIGDGGRFSTGATSTQASYNTVCGWLAGGNISSSSFNSAYGYGSLANQTTGGVVGGSNSGFGSSSLGYISTGDNNTAIGSSAGAGIVGNSIGNTTSKNSVYVGNNTNAKVNGGDNEIVIGGSTDGNGSNTATLGNASITNTYIRGLTYDYIAVTTTYTVLMTDHIVVCGGTTAYTVTLPSAVTAGAGREFILKRTSTVAGTITITPVSAQTIDGTAGNNTTLLGTNYNKVHLVSNGTNWLTL